MDRGWRKHDEMNGKDIPNETIGKTRFPSGRKVISHAVGRKQDLNKINNTLRDETINGAIFR